MTEQPTDPAEVDLVAMRAGTEPSAVSSNLYCWLWAAFPPKVGRLDIPRVARGLGVSATTIRRWLRDHDTELTHESMVMIHRRAILRGHGHYRWPPVDDTTLRRSRHAASAATASLKLEPSSRDKAAGRTRAHTVEQVYYPRAHVFGLTAHQTTKHSQRIRNYGGIALASIERPNLWSAVLLREQLLDQVGAGNRVIAPSDMVRTGRTHTWLERAGQVSLADIVDEPATAG